MDTVSWSKSRFDKVRAACTTFFESASFPLKAITFVPVAGLTGDNVTSPSTSPDATWYTGPTLLAALDASTPRSRSLTNPLRLTINDVFRGSGQNPLSVSGQIEAGTLQLGDTLLALPSRESAVVKGIQLPDGSTADWVVAGQIPTLHLVDIDVAHLRAGDVLVSPPPAPVPRLVKSFTAKMLAFEHVVPQWVDVFRGRQKGVGVVESVAGVLDKYTGEVVRKRARVVRPGEVARVRVELRGKDGKEGEKEGLPLEVGARVVLREGGRTVGAGLVESYS